MSLEWNATRCFWCIEQDAVEDAHVIPRGWFPRPIASDLDLPVVPSCSPCNQEQRHRDDEDLFRAIVSAHINANEPGLAHASGKVLRGLQKNPRVRKQLFRSVVDVAVNTSAGLHVGQIPGFRVEQPAVDRIMWRVARGLYYAEYGERLPTYQAIEWTMWNKPHVASSLAGTLEHRAFKPVVEYLYGRASDARARSLWHILFFSGGMFFIATDPSPIVPFGRRITVTPSWQVIASSAR